MQVDGRVLLMHITYLFQVNSVSVSAVSAVSTWISGPCAHAVERTPQEPDANCLPDDTQSQGASPRESAAHCMRLRGMKHRGK
jgi:hypothetical protein